MTRGDRPPGVRVEDLWVSYRRFFRRDRVLKGVELTARPGEVTAIIGRNGVGKTTLFRALLGFQVPDRGRITVGGLSPHEYRLAHGIGYLPESVAFPASWIVRDVLGRGADLAVPGSDRSGAFSIAVERAGFDEATLSKKANHCSRGLQQRMGLAYALIGEPEVVLLDEPFSGLDPPSRIALRRDVGEVIDRGATLLLASHDLAEVARLATTIFLMEDGKVRRRPPSPTETPGPESGLEAMFMDDEP